ncbi:MAG TPA: serine/threonine protein kinase, partial [Opitutaceae bacterium]|nr:serine/threonine protein kinase [Opitutaceae bacterium]
MRAMEKDRTRRYETANGLAVDVQRYLSDEPVVARPPSRIYRLRKLIRRNRILFAAGAAVASILVCGLGASTYLFLREREARQRAVAAEQQQARLRRDAELREKITQVAFLVSQEKYEEADRLAVTVSSAQPTVEAASVFRSLGEWHARALRWKEASERLTFLLRLNTLDGWDNASLDCLRCGPALIEFGDANLYERFRQEIVARFAGTPCPFGDRILKIGLLLPAEGRDMSTLAPIANATRKFYADAKLRGDVFLAAWISVSLALWEYRQGDFDSAVRWCESCIASPEPNASRTATVHLIRAMSYGYKGRLVDAQADLMRGREIIENKYSGRLEQGGPVQGFWFDWMFARILLKEANAAVGAQLKKE